MKSALIIIAGLAGAASSVLWYTPGQMDVRTATIGAGVCALLCAVLMARLIDHLQGR